MKRPGWRRSTVVSQQVARLEREFRTSLLVRTTRSVKTTEVGQSFYLRCALILREAEHAFDDLAETSAEPSGTLRLTAPFDYGVVSPSMERQVAQLTRPEEIVNLPFVANTALRDNLKWNFSLNEVERQIAIVRASIFLDATLAVREAVCQGAGLSVLPDYAVADDLAAGRLIQVLPQWRLPSGGIHAVFPAARFRPAKVRAFVDLLAEREAQRQDRHGAAP